MSRSVQSTIVNGTPYDLTLDASKTGLSAGAWNGGPVEIVKSFTSRTVGEAVGGSEVSGNFTYTANNQDFTFGFYNPRGADNAFSCKAPTGFYVCPFVQNGGYGTSTPAVIYVLCEASGASQPIPTVYAHKSCQATIVNGTGYNLKLHKELNIEGWFDGGPVDEVGSKQIRVAAHQYSNNPQCRADLTYTLEGVGNIKIGWDITFATDNIFTWTSLDGYFVCGFIQNGGYRTPHGAVTFVICQAVNGN